MSTRAENLDKVTKIVLKLAEESPILNDALVEWQEGKYTWLEMLTLCVLRQAKEIGRLQNYIDKECK